MVQTQALWSKTKTGGKAGFDKLYGWVDKLGPPVNRLSNKLGSEAFWPTTLDIESDKAARILKSFCKDGFYQEEERPTADGPKQKQKVLKKIPAEVIKNAKGLAIFTTMRTGLWVSGAGGSGILVARKADGTWSPPSGIMLHTAGLGFLVGVDIYDCVVVINSQKALDAFSSIRCTLGGEISAVAGPLGVGGLLETEVHKRQAPVFTYLKSRGFYAGVQIDGTVIIERTDENERFYGERIPVADILSGKVRHPPYETRRLLETIKSAQGDSNIDQSLIPDGAPPADYEIEASEGQIFGVPDEEDPDPFGVRALEQAGLEIREAGTKKLAPSEEFEFKPSPTSPIYTTFRRSMDRSSMDALSRRSSWRTSTISSIMATRSTQMSDMSTQTDLDALAPPPAPRARPLSAPPPLPPRQEPKMVEIPEGRSVDDDAIPPAKKDSAEVESRPGTADSNAKVFDEVDMDDDEDDDEYEEPIVEEVHQASAPHIINRARIVTVAKPIPPKLPARNPFRKQLNIDSDVANVNSTRDMGAGPSPMIATELSPPSTPSLKNDGSSASSKDSILSVDGLERVSEGLQPKPDYDTFPRKEEEVHSRPESPMKPVPGGFV
ncbi:DUF500-domain-containing protein [Amniculicola lignicola CBS 123094]|uniref:DUF500-domain-containing protein n=1 Tax=Amniculicola lignicola CBS 123094 TaxID=1392246 RepID=A0A6A5WEP2_9PLEO|nr:DUF500-domain-containing protein [Amniculicola lignicola CBS 123094]